MGASRRLGSRGIDLYPPFVSFFGGNIIFRGHFNATGQETGFNLTVEGGFGFAYSVYLNGEFLGSGQGNGAVDQLTHAWDIPEGVLYVGEDNVLVVIQGELVSDTSIKTRKLTAYNQTIWVSRKL